MNICLKDSNASLKDIEKQLLLCVHECLDDPESEGSSDPSSPLTDDDENFLRRMLKKAARLEDPVFSILKRRILDSLRKQFLLSPNIVADDYHLRSLGLSAIVQDFHDMMNELHKISSHLVKVHNQRLLKIVLDIVSYD
ncbi:hypothetical protein Gasu2_10000 [Galdieria sulphuraria]|nr:hypothetical protein Gasu2_10000 [Galdieria sulphuraria]